MRNLIITEKPHQRVLQHTFGKNRQHISVKAKTLTAAQKDWQKLQKWIRAKKARLIIVLAGTDQFAIETLCQSLLDAPYDHIIHTPVITPDDTWHLQQLMAALPAQGNIALFKNNWYANVLQDLSNMDADDAYAILQEMVNFEKMLLQTGIYLLKIGLTNTEEVNPVFTFTQHHAAPWQIYDSNYCSNAYLLNKILDSLPFQDLSFSNTLIKHDALKNRAYNLRWATVAQDVIPLTAADPDFPIAQEIQQAIIDYTKVGVFSYGPAEGLPTFRKAAAKVVRQRKKVDTEERLILPVDGAASGMFTIARCTLSPGDEAIIFDPVDFLFQQSIEAAGAKIVRLPFNLTTRTFDPITLVGLISPKTKMIAICNPHNPIGRVLNKTELEVIGALAIKHDLWIMNDEIWSDIVYEQHSFISISSIHPKVAARTITVHGFSKTFGLAGLRIGFIVAPNTKIYQKLLQASKANNTAGGATTLSQIAATAAYTDAWHWADAFVQHLKKIRDYSVNRLNNMEGVHCHSPEGTYVLLVNIEYFKLSSEAMADYLLKIAKVAVVPGAAKWFGPGAEGHIRICFSTSLEIMEEALNRIEAALKNLSSSLDDK